MQNLAPDVLQLPPGECELLYGRSGYLYALLFVRKYLGASAVRKDVVSPCSPTKDNQLHWCPACTKACDGEQLQVQRTYVLLAGTSCCAADCGQGTTDGCKAPCTSPLRPDVLLARQPLSWRCVS